MTSKMSSAARFVQSSSTFLVLVLVTLWSPRCQARRYAWNLPSDSTPPSGPPSTPSVPLDPQPADPFLRLGQGGSVRTPSGVLPPGRAWTARNALADLINGLLPDPAIPVLDPSTTPPTLLDGALGSRGGFSFQRTLDQALARLFVRYVKLKQSTMGKSGGDYIRSSVQLFRALCQLLNQKDPANTFCFSITNQSLPKP